MAEILESPIGDTHPCVAQLYGAVARQLRGREKGQATARHRAQIKSRQAGHKDRADLALRKF